MPTVIDSLIVKLGLDPSNFTKGQKEAARQTIKTKETVTKQSEEMVKALKEVGLSFAKLFIGIGSVIEGVKYLGALNQSTAELGRTAANLGMSAHVLNTWGNAVELAGGKAGDAQADFTKLSGALTALQATGEVSPLILLFQRLGIALKDQRGNVRPLTDLYQDLAEKLSHYTRQNAFNLASSAGLSEGMLNLLLREKSARAEIFQQAEANNNVDQARVDQADKLQRAWRNIGQEIKNVAQDVLTAVTPAVQGVFGWVSKTWAQFKDVGGIKVIAGIFDGIWGVVKLIANGLKLAFNAIANSTIGKWYTGVMKSYMKFLGGFGGAVKDRINELADASDEAVDSQAANRKEDDKRDAVQEAADAKAEANKPRNLRNNNPGNIKATGNQNRDAQGFAIYGSMSEGISALDSQLDRYSRRGINTIKSIVETYEGKDAPGNHNDIEGYTKFLEKRLGVDRNQQIGKWERQGLIGGISDFEGARGAVTPAAISRVIGPTPGIIGRNGATVASNKGVTNSTNVQVDKIEIHTQATDAHGIAATIPDAMRRRGIVAQTDTGQS